MNTILKIWAVISPVIMAIAHWISKNRDDIAAIFLRVQKDVRKGMSNKKIEQAAVDLFFQKLYPDLPFWARLIGHSFWEKRVRKLAKYYCKKAKQHKK